MWFYLTRPKGPFQFLKSETFFAGFVCIIRPGQWAHLPSHTVPHTNQILTVITASSRVLAKCIGPFHRRILALKGLGFGALVERAVCAGRGKWHAAFSRLDDFICVGGTTQLEVEKFFSVANFTQGDNSDWEAGSLSRRSSNQLYLFNHLLGGSSVLGYLIKLSVLRALVLVLVLPVFSIKMSFSASKLCDVALLSMSICDVIERAMS